MRLFVIVILVLMVAPTLSFAEPPNQRLRDAFLAASPREKRAWMYDRMVLGSRDVRVTENARITLTNMSPEQLDEAFLEYGAAMDRRYQQTLGQSRAQLSQAEAYRQQLIRQYQQRLRAARRPVGYSPIITTLPQGASLTAGAVVSPDRRYVRINATPFFSTIGPVHTFNFRTGQYNQIVPPAKNGQGLP